MSKKILVAVDLADLKTAQKVIEAAVEQSLRVGVLRRREERARPGAGRGGQRSGRGGPLAEGGRAPPAIVVAGRNDRTAGVARKFGAGTVNPDIGGPRHTSFP